MPAAPTLHDALHDLLCRFQAAFDDHDWPTLGDCLADEIATDYSALRGTPPSVQARADYVAQRSAALSTLRMQHNFSNLRVEARGDGAQGRCNYAILRFAAEGGGHFHSYGRYDFTFTRDAGGGWRIAGIVQRQTASDGDPALHAGARGR